jgi:hypothetical protein
VEKTKSPTSAAGLLSLQMVRLSVLIAIGLALAAALLAGLLSAALLLLTGLRPAALLLTGLRIALLLLVTVRVLVGVLLAHSLEILPCAAGSAPNASVVWATRAELTPDRGGGTLRSVMGA